MAAGALALAAILTGLLVLASGGDDDQASADAGGLPTEPLERRSLAEEISVDGNLGFGDEAAVVNRLSGTITWLPDAGAEIGRGDRLFEVDGEPVLLMYGEVPAYRDLSASSSEGPDVKQLEANLAELGFDAGGAMTVDSEFTSVTSEAVGDWQESLGLDRTGTVELGRVVFQAGKRRVSSLDVALGASADSGASGASTTGSSVSTEAQGSVAVLASYTATSDIATSAQTVSPAPEEGNQEDDPAEDPSGTGGKGGSGQGGKGGSGKTGGRAPSDGGSSQAPSGSQAPAASTTSPAASDTGSSAESSSPSTQVMTTTSTARAVTVQLDPEQVSAAKRGSKVGVTLPDGAEVEGRISSVGTVAAAETTEDTEQGQATEDATIEVTIDLPGDKGTGALDEAPVSVDLTDDVTKDVFAVPVAALIGTAGNEYAIVVREGSESRQVAVEPGVFADGYVEIEGEGLEEGLEVEVPDQ